MRDTCGLRWAVGILSVLGFAAAGTAEWKPAENPLMTRWAKDVSPGSVWPEYPRPQMVRKDWLNLNGLWSFALTERDAAQPATFDRSILVPFCPDSALSGLRLPVLARHRMWYRRDFEIPAAWRGKRIRMHFGAVDWDAAVSVNGKAVGRHRGGYSPFRFDITDALRADGPQDVVVSVWDPTGEAGEPVGKQAHPAGGRPGGIHYTRVSGIWQTVWLEPVPPVCIYGLTITPDVDQGCVRIAAQCAGDAEGATLDAVVTMDGKSVAQAAGPVGGPLTLKIPEAKLWTPDSPALYDLRVTLRGGADGEDSVDSYFGMRKISIGPDERGITRMLLNNEFVFHLGPLDQGYWPDGLYTAPTDEALKFDVEVMKKYGFNMARKHVKVEPARWYYWCDKLGILVWQDMPSGGNRSAEAKEQFERELEEMILSLYNHPSIVMWVPFNEGWGQYDTPRIVETVRRIDPTRLVNNASGWTDTGVGDVRDIHSYPVPGAPRPEPGRASVIGEYGGLGYNMPGHRWHESGWGYALFNGPDELNERYEDICGVVHERAREPGISGAVYTQLTDIEAENNGLLTYDREIFKIDPAMAAAHRGYLSPGKVGGANVFMDAADVELTAGRADAPIHYTLDGSEPSLRSPRYEGPIRIMKDTTIKAVTAIPGGGLSRVRTFVMKKEAPRKAANPRGVQPGLRLSYFELNRPTEQMPDVEALQPTRVTTVTTVALPAQARRARMALLFEGWIRVPVSGAYVFRCSSDDGSRLVVAGEKVVENDGIHGMREVAGSIVLEAGDHPIRLLYFQNEGGLGLELRYEGPGLAAGAIPAEALWHSP